MNVCNVSGCYYTQSADIDGFPVCSLHDGEHVKAMLHRFERPGHFWCNDRPIILPVGPLTEEHFASQQHKYPRDPEKCSYLAAIDFNCHSNVLPKFDLTKAYE